MKIAERNLKVAICIAHVVFFCWFIIFPMRAEACGWFGENKYDDDESVLEETEVSTVLDENNMILDPATQTEVGNLYREGRRVARDYVKALHWYRKAANQGFAGAQNNLAVMYEQGLGVPKNKPEAAKWYLAAAEQYNAYAQHSIGGMYRDGEGVLQDFEEAVKWFSKAAEQGHYKAFRDMGEMHLKGLGVPQNNIQACMWWRLGALYGDKESEKLFNIAAAKMKSSHVAEAQKLAQEWIQKHK